MQLKTDKVIEKTLKNFKFLTGKKSILFGFSYGNLHIWNSLNKLTLNDKNLLVHSYMAVSPPFLGSFKVLKT